METYRFKNGVEVKNRVVLAPMTIPFPQPDGSLSDEEIAYYESRSNGVGMAVTGSTFVTPNGKLFDGGGQWIVMMRTLVYNAWQQINFLGEYKFDTEFNDER